MKSLKHFCFRIWERISKEDYDAVIAITGDEGIGKSSLAYWILVFISELSGLDFSLLMNCVFNPDYNRLLTMLQTYPKHAVLWLDEAVDLLYKMDFMNKKTRFIVKTFTKDRNQNRVKLLLIPRFTDLTENLRNHRVAFHIHCYARGKAVVLKKESNIKGLNTWGSKKRDLLFSEFKNSMKNRLIYYNDRVFNYPLATKRAYPNNFAGVLSWDKMPKEVWVEYNKLKDEANKETIEEEVVTPSLRLIKYAGTIIGLLEYIKVLKGKYNVAEKYSNRYGGLNEGAFRGLGIKKNNRKR